MFGDGLEASQDNINYKAIACEQIPELFLDKIVAKKHFSKYGKIKRFILRPKRLCCTVEYENKEDAKNALLNAGSFNGIDFVINYAEHDVAHVQNTEEWVDPEVQAELEAMSHGHRLGATLRNAATVRSNGGSKISLFSPKICKAFGNNRQDSPQPEFSKVDSAVRQELETILKTPAFTYEEKYRVLDARDKLIRLTTIRQTDIKKAVAIKGTCPDMCPEKERLMREFQRQVSCFEMTEEENSEATLSHKKAIKEYSRSSADQEVPLAHELRSESVLQMTMLYLVHRIMALCDDPKTSLCDWFHFVWDRTRSIRKDITQQELCSLEAVQLVEQCARFHIHCAARLVAEDPSVFDKKINAENLTKCLQTLKYMYHDLRIKNVVCPCESEFRSYVILLNLGDSNFLWELKQLPENIQRSVEIKQAIKFYNALQNNNFVNFFSMIKSHDTSYLSACILLGYFTKLRVRALDAIIKSHNWRKNDVYLPLSYLTRVLGFEDESSAVNFFNHYGLNCDILEKRVLIDRLMKPNVEYAMDRALKLVESKRQVSVGECVFGQRLPSPSLFENHEPHCSFHENGMFKIDLLAANDHLIPRLPKDNANSKQQKTPTNTNISSNEINLFKIPLALTPILPKPRSKQHTEHNVNEIKKNLSDPLFTEKEESTSSPGGFKFCDNIFSGNPATRTTNESIFNTKSEQFTNNNFPANITCSTEKPLNAFKNIFAGNTINAQSETNNIFSLAVRETANLFQHQKDKPKETIVNDNGLQKLQECSENRTFPFTSSKTDFSASEVKLNESFILGNEIDSGSIIAGNEKKETVEQIKEEIIIKEEKCKQQEILERDINELKTALEKTAIKTMKLFIFDLIEDEVISIAKTELLISQTITEASYLQTKKLFSEVITDLVEDTVNEEYDLMCHDQLLLNRYFSKWLKHSRTKREQRKLIENIPVWITTNTRAELAQDVKHPCQVKNMEMIKRYRFGHPCDFNNVFKMEYDILSDEKENSLNLFALVGQHLLAKRNFTSSGLLQQRKYFKFLITLPGSNEELLGFKTLANKWLMKLIEKCQTEGGPFVQGIEHNVALCVRKLCGIIPKNEQGNEMTTEGDHNDGVVCFISGIEIATHSRKRLYNLLKATKNLKRVPLAVVAYNCNCNNEELAELLGLDILQEDGLIYSYIILGCQVKKNDCSFRKLFINAVNFITKESYNLNSNEVQALAMQNILSFLETTLGEEMWQRWICSAKSNTIFNKICKLPVHVLGIYHKALDHLLHITQEDFDEMPEFPTELSELVPDFSCSNIPLGLECFPSNWKEKIEKNLVKTFLQSLHLPVIDEKVPDDIENVTLWLLKYSSKCIVDDDLAATKASHEAITNLSNQINVNSLSHGEFSLSTCMINYLTVFKPIIFAHINRKLNQSMKGLMNLKVIYLKDDLRNYQTQPWWLNYEPLNLVTIDHSEMLLSLPHGVQLPEVKIDNYLDLSDDADKIIAQAQESARKADNVISEYERKKRIHSSNPFANISSTSQLMRTLDDSLYHFELSKKVGQYDTSFVTDLTRDVEKSISKVLNRSHISKQKRKISSNQYSDVNQVIAKATKLIHKFESTEDKKLKMKIN